MIVGQPHRTAIGERTRASIAAALALAAAAAAATDLTSPIGSNGDKPAAPWRVVGLPEQKKPLTRFDVVDKDGQRVLRIDADHAYGNLVHPVKDTRAGTLSWRWRVDEPPSGANLLKKSGDDAALKVCASFDVPSQRLPFLERQLLRLAQSRSNEPLPTATLCYVWDTTLAPDTLLHNAYTHRLRFIVVHGTVGRWSEERHDLAADFRRAFGDESGDAPGDVPLLTAIAIGADSDNTGSHSVAYIDRLRLTPPPP